MKSDKSMPISMAQKNASLRFCFIIAVLLVSLVTLKISLLAPWPWYKYIDFAHYYISASLFRDGINPYVANIAPLYSKFGFEPSSVIDHASNPPALMFITLPFTFFSPKISFFIWSLLQVAALITAVIICLRIFNIKTGVVDTWFIVLSALVTIPCISHIRYGQTQMLILLLCVLGLRLLRQESVSSVWAGSFLWGVAASLKLFTFPLIFVLWRYKGIKSVGIFLLGFVIPALPAMLFLGPGIILDYLAVTLPFLQKAAFAYVGNLSLSATAFYLFIIFHVGGSIWTLLRVVEVISFGALFFVLYLDLHNVDFSREEFALSASICISACMLFSPVCWIHYFVLYSLPLLTMLGFAVSGKRSALLKALLIIGYVSLTAPYGIMHGAPQTVQSSLALRGLGPHALILFLLFAVKFYRRSEITTG